MDDKDYPKENQVGKVKVKKVKNRAEVKVPYSATKVKARNFLINISYRHIKEQDLDNFSFIVDVYLFLKKDFNPFFFFDSKFSNNDDCEMVLMLWQHRNHYMIISKNQTTLKNYTVAILLLRK